MNFPDGLKNKKIIISRLGRLYSRAGALIDSLFKVLNWHCFRVLLENYKNSFFRNTLLKKHSGKTVKALCHLPLKRSDRKKLKKRAFRKNYYS